MRKIILLLLIFVAAFTAYAQEQEQEWERYPYTLGAGIEMNMATREGWGQGYLAVIDRHIFDEHFVAGLRGGMNNDFNGITSLEASLFARLYPFKLGLGGAFVQLGWGISTFQEDELRPLVFLFDASAGFRFFFLGGFYAEASVRSGYPDQWAFGVLGGHRFSF
jgi:hypothetical protein